MHSDRSSHPVSDETPKVRQPLFGSGTTFFLVALAVILAIVFFYMTKDAREDRRADAVTEAAASVDNATARVGSAAQNVARDLRQGQ
ncbi:hypothetical protein [Sphingobium amiense]|uniref:hypothetical protein n=1 Tax=Sphingobium amiense TaxID=135719 RepID=UPI00082FC294|nr:hypothetical protein [Sphingobium amiense]